MRSSKLVLALVLAAAVVLAGCGGNGGGTSTTFAPNGSATTAADAGTTADPGERLADRELPAGLAASGVENATALVESHEAALAESGAKSTFSVELRSSAGNQTSVVTQTRGADGTALLDQRVETRLGTQRVDLYANATTTFQRTNSSRGVGYSVLDRGAYLERTENTRQLPVYLQGSNFSVAGVEERDGGTFVTLRSETVSNRSALGLPDSTTVENFTGTVVVDLDGRIHSVALEYELVSGGTTVDQTVRYDLETVGVESVDRPDWTETATEQAIAADLTIAADDGAVRITNEGGDPIPAESQVAVAASDGSDAFAATFESELAPGETATVYRNETSSPRGTVVVGDAPDGVGTGIDGSVQVTVRSGDGLELIAVGTVELPGDATASVRRLPA